MKFRKNIRRYNKAAELLTQKTQRARRQLKRLRKKDSNPYVILSEAKNLSFC
jgi:hypothetical protein